jgi:hypothetical protein
VIAADASSIHFAGGAIRQIDTIVAMANQSLSAALPDAGVRFGLRTVLAVTVLAAGVAAIAGWIYRSADGAAREILLAFWAASALTATAIAIVRWWGNYRLALAAGPTRFRLSQSDAVRLHFNLISFLPFGLWAPGVVACVAALLWIAGSIAVA